MKNDFLAQMNKVLENFDNPRLLLHSCCAPCSSYCLLNLRNHSRVSVYYYNPNITDPSEYDIRFKEQRRLIDEYNKDINRKLPDECVQILNNRSYVNQIEIMESFFEPSLFLEKTKGYEECPERGARCAICFEMRLRDTALKAKENGFDMFATTLTLSPLKDASLINSIGGRIAKEVDIMYLPTDFKKKNGYKMSIELSKEYGLYRQNYCGCVYSKNK